MSKMLFFFMRTSPSLIESEEVDGESVDGSLLATEESQ